MTTEENTTESNPVSRGWLKTSLLLSALSVLGIIISLALIELLFRIFTALAPVAQRWDDRPREYFLPQSALTLQDFNYSAKKPAGHYRIAVVGDSFTFAPYMQFDDAFPKRLERWLNLNDSQPKVDVINYGVPRYSTSHEARISEKAIEQGADLILLQITLNDPEIKPYWPTGLVLDELTGEVKLQNPLYTYWKSLGFVMTRLENSKTHREYKNYFFRLFKKRDTLNQFTSSLKKIATLSAEKKVPVVAVVFPLFGYPVNEEYPFYPIHTQIAELLAELKIPMLDVTAQYQWMPLDRLQVIPGGDRHPNEIAHRIAAEGILKWFESEKIVPEAILPKKRAALRVGLQDVPAEKLRK